jgi:hypothetical protein
VSVLLNTVLLLELAVTVVRTVFLSYGAAAVVVRLALRLLVVTAVRQKTQGLLAAALVAAVQTVKVTDQMAQSQTAAMAVGLRVLTGWGLQPLRLRLLA